MNDEVDNRYAQSR